MSATGGSNQAAPSKRRNWLPLLAVLLLAALVGLAVWSAQSGRPPLADRQAAEGHVQEARRLANERNIEAALKAIAQAKQSDPTWTQPYLVKADILMISAQYRAAREEILAAPRLAPDDPAVLHALIRNSSLLPPAEQEALARRGIAANPADADAWQFLGDAIVATGDPKRYPEALQAFENALQRAPSGVEPLISIAKLKVLTGENDRAAEILEHVSEVVEARAAQGPISFAELPDWVEKRRAVAFWLAQIYQQMGKKEQAKAQTSLAAKWSARASELRRLQDRANATPPDKEARARLDQIARTGRLD